MSQSSASTKEALQEVHALRARLGILGEELSRNGVDIFAGDTAADATREVGAKLRDSEERQRIAVRAAGLGVFEWNVAEDRAIWENDRMYELVGHTRADGTVNRDLFLSEYVHPDDAVSFVRELTGSGERREPFRIACRVRRKTDGMYRWLEFAGDYNFGPDGAPTKLVGVVADVTDQRVAADALRAAEERYLAIVNQLDKGFCTIELRYDEHGRPVDYRFCEVNSAFESQTGLLNAAGRWIRDIVPDQDEHWFVNYGRVAKTGISERFETFSSPLARWWAVFAFPIGDPAHRRIGVFFNDITARKIIEIELLRLASIVQKSGDFIGASDAKGDPIFLNAAGRRLVGLSGDLDLRTTAIRDFFIPEERPFIDEVVIPSMVKNGRWAGELTFRHWITGAHIPVWYDIFRVDDPVTGEPVNFATITRDITERKRVEEMLRDARTRLASTLTAAEVGTFHWNIEEDSLVGDANFQHIVGVKGDGRGASLAWYLDRVHVEDRTRISAAVSRAVKERGPYSEEYRILHPDGQVRWVHARGLAKMSDDGKLRELPGVVVDITDRKEAEEGLKAAHRRWRLALEGAEMGSWNIDPAGQTLESDERFRIIFSGDTEPISYVQAFDMLHPDDRHRIHVAIQAAVDPKNPAPYSEDYRVIHADGSIHWVRAIGGVTFGEGRRVASSAQLRWHHHGYHRAKGGGRCVAGKYGAAPGSEGRGRTCEQGEG